MWRTASVLEALAATQGAQGRLESAACLLGAAEAVREAISVCVPLCERPDHEHCISVARAGLGEVAFEAAFLKGRVMPLERAVEYALGGRTGEPAAPPAAAPAPERTGPSGGPAVTAGSKASTGGLRIFALGPARVEKDGHPLDSPDWIQKPRELLYYLLSHPPRTKEQIGLALWPEASISQLRGSFHDTVYRLRRALGGKQWIVFEQGRYAFDRSLPYSFDVEAFEENVSAARRVRTEAPAQAIRHLQEATGLYGGDFLEAWADSEWAMVRQEELRRAYQEALLLLGRLLFEQDRHAEAADVYRKAIAHDGFLEEAHRGLMRCHSALGERGRALRHYEQLVALLDERLGAPPAFETRALYESLRSGRVV